MAYYFGYRAKGTCINGLIQWLETNKLYTTYEEFEQSLIDIRLRYEPNKPTSKDAEKNAIYVSEKIGFGKFRKHYGK